MTPDWIIPAAKAAIPILTSLLKSRTGADAPSGDVVGSNIDRHMSYALNWSGTLQIFDMAAPREIGTSTLPLGFSTEPRRFITQRSTSSTPLAEDDLLARPMNYLILGDVGAGKTTSIKRLVQRLLISPPTSASDHYAFPIVIVCRELGHDGSLPVAVATRLGIPFSDAPKGAQLSRPLSNQFWCGSTPLMDAVVEFINRSNAVLFVDGIDELGGELRRRIEEDLVALARQLRDGKIIASLRAGEFRHTFQGFNVVQVAPLSPTQTRMIAAKWLSDPEPFLQQLRSLPYSDVVDRPLLLMQLLFLYRRYGTLPEQPKSVYQSLIDLLLRDWDADQTVVRRSRYSRFDSHRKAEFLSALAYHLTYQFRATRFDNRILYLVYLRICDRFNLPAGEAGDVVAELESHTGILAAAGPHETEFIHLSMQEYLCAEYLVRNPRAERMVDYLRAYPAPVAIAVALAYEPSEWFADVMLHNGKDIPPDVLASFLARVVLEQPSFGVNEDFGHSLLYLFAQGAKNGGGGLVASLQQIASRFAGRESIELASVCYRCIDVADDLVLLASHNQKPARMPVPTEAAVPIELLRRSGVQQAFNLLGQAEKIIREKERTQS